MYLFKNHIFLIKSKHLRTNLNIDLLETEFCKKKNVFRNTIKKKIRYKTGTNQPQNRNFDRQLSKHPTVFEYAHDYLDNRLTKWLGVWDEKAPLGVSNEQAPKRLRKNLRLGYTYDISFL